MILHIDMDAFYASVEIRDNPALKGLPVAVGGSPQGRGVVSAASYVARKYGIHSAMPSKIAIQRCRDLVFLPVNMAKYVAVSEQIREIFYRYTPDVEPLSLDEAFLDVSACEKLFGSAVEIGKAIKAAIKNELDLTASVGIASCKYVAKVASDINKPDGFVFVASGRETDFLDPLPVNYLWGIGKASLPRFKQYSLYTIKDVRTSALKDIESEFGKLGRAVWYLSNGMDSRSVESERTAKSVSHETTFSNDICDLSILEAILIELTESVGKRLRKNELKGKTISLKLRLADFSRVNRSRSLLEPTASTREIWTVAKQLLQQYFKGSQKSLRLIGVSVSGFDKVKEARQQKLFQDDNSESQQADQSIDKVTDEINSKFGNNIIHRARSGMKQTD